ncbi:hypothetical protein SprV_0200941900 [Sparganum proliferum]
MPFDACRDERLGIRIAYKSENQLSNWCVQAPTTAVHDLVFVEECVSNTTTEPDIQRNMQLFASPGAKFEMTLMVMHQSSNLTFYRITINDIHIKTVDNFVHLDSKLSRIIKIDE